MIEFKIVNSPDKSQQATYHHVGQELVIGRSEGDMIVDDPQLSPRQIRIYFQGDQAILENLNPDLEVRLNGKPVEGATPIKEKDNLTMARTTINIARADHSPLTPPEPVQHPQFAQRVTPGSKEKALLDALEHLATEAGAPTTAAPPLPGGAPKPPIPPSPNPPIPPGRK